MTHMMPWSTTALWEALARPASVYSSRVQKEELAGTETEQSGPDEEKKKKKPKESMLHRGLSDAVNQSKAWTHCHVQEVGGKVCPDF